MKHYHDKKADYFSSTRTDILELIPNFSQRVLEIGCGSGKTLAMLKKKKLCTETVGIELFPEAADEARNNIDLVYCMDVEKQTLPDTIGTFDLILLLDVLEHLVDPWSLLTRLTEKHLSVGGRVIISLPNARHFSLVGPLLFGKFDYTERGIIDKTHLRFFTRSSAVKLLHSAGLTIEATKRTSLDISLNSGKFNLITLGLFSEFLASQYIFRAMLRGKN
ncbi:class I SAM-dependent methyltransferase [Desulfopila sp. IMCC35006]|uniref:class I SAM-dependent methyltransferase n=1 Tax=Desulfopila sp. IMCC35006 TaxID=2569542 RepID=UPI0010AC2661|nr:class I SAM-dependent methyltransferase [Desulfopila sp. IMCC35006]TKB26134.1 class I SAM-dependent methyltransferase [Desulfopila sp. IMCC35006]